MLSLSNSSGRHIDAPHANWESDVQEIAVEVCDGDPSGYRVVFYKSDDNSESYSIGASFLKKRLAKLRKAGFDAPMTKEAIKIMYQKHLRTLKYVS